jgi:hypothetical protein
MKTYGGVLSPALGGGEWSASRFGFLTPRERAPGIRCVGGRVGPRACLNAVEKNLLAGTRTLTPSVIKLLARRCTD